MTGHVLKMIDAENNFYLSGVPTLCYVSKYCTFEKRHNLSVHVFIYFSHVKTDGIDCRSLSKAVKYNMLKIFKCQEVIYKVLSYVT